MVGVIKLQTIIDSKLLLAVTRNNDQFGLMHRQRYIPRKVPPDSIQPLDNFTGVHCDRFIKHFHYITWSSIYRKASKQPHILPNYANN